ncbi:MAG: membrane protein insertase YidC [Acidimicrobiales bacterium]
MTSLFIASSGGFWGPIANPIASVLAFFYSLFPNYGIAIVLLTTAMMIVLIPLTIKQTRSMLVMQKLQPEMKRLQEQHKNDRQALNEAVMALYKEHNASPLGGCLPMLLPFPLFFALYRVLEGLSHLVHKGKIVMSQPEYLSKTTRMYQDIVKAHGKLDSFGLDLAKTAKNAGGGFAHSLPYFVLLLLMVGTQFYQQYQLTSKNPAMKSQPGQAMMMKVIPLVFGVISFAFPAGLIVYWTVSNIFRIGQQWALYRYDPKVMALVSEDVKEVEAKTREIDAGGTTTTKGSRPRFRDLLNNASEAAAERRSGGAKGGTGPGDKTGSGRNAAGGTKKPGSTTPAKAGGGQKSPPQKAAGSSTKGPVTKTVPGKTGPTKPGGAKPAAAKPGADKPGVTKGTPAKAGSGQPGTNAKPSGPPRTGTPAKNGSPNKSPTPAKAAPNGDRGVAANGAGAPKTGTGAGSPGNTPAGTNGTNGTSGTNGRSKAPVTGNGADSQDLIDVATSDGADAAEGAGTASSDGAPATNGAPKGRTGGGRTGAGSSRAISGNRRRKGR